MNKYFLLLSAFFLTLSGYSQVWQDEFSGETLNTDKWSVITGDGCPDLCGFGNNELQYYTSNSKNLRIEDGKLIIEVHNESVGSRKYTAAKIVSKEKGDWKYGKVVVRAKLPSGRGTWPAIWMLPTILDRNLDWPLDGEIDIMEHVGYDQNRIHGTVHTAAYNGMIGTQKSGQIIVEDCAQEFHDYSIIWNEEKIEWFVDDEKYFEYFIEDGSKEVWPFNKPFHLILNVAVGGDWGGSKGVDDTIWPQRMEIDYVKVFKQ